MDKNILDTLSHLIHFNEVQVAKFGVRARSELEPILNNARESYSKAVEAYAKPQIPEVKEKTERRKRRST